ncbi:hypothetical protein PENTCL1PPCAC_3533, partial [Pristionchus entomophagus]
SPTPSSSARLAADADAELLLPLPAAADALLLLLPAEADAEAVDMLLPLLLPSTPPPSLPSEATATLDASRSIYRQSIDIRCLSCTVVVCSNYKVFRHIR